MLLNKINVLDKGYVAYISAHNNGDMLKDISLDLLRADFENKLYNLASLTIAIRCPLFVQLNISKFNLTMLDMPVEEIDAYKPDESEIKSKDREANVTIADDIGRTTEALLINPIAYQKDGCDRFISQVISPISVYNELVISGSLGEWLKFARQKGLPRPVQLYCNAVKGIIQNEWKRLEV